MNVNKKKKMSLVKFLLLNFVIGAVFLIAPELMDYLIFKIIDFSQLFSFCSLLILFLLIGTAKYTLKEDAISGKICSIAYWLMLSLSAIYS